MHHKCVRSNPILHCTIRSRSLQREYLINAQPNAEHCAAKLRIVAYYYSPTTASNSLFNVLQGELQNAKFPPWLELNELEVLLLQLRRKVNVVSFLECNQNQPPPHCCCFIKVICMQHEDPKLIFLCVCLAHPWVAGLRARDSQGSKCTIHIELLAANLHWQGVSR